MVSQYMTLQFDTAGELPVTALSGAQEVPLLPRVRTQLMQVQKPGVVEESIAVFTHELL